MVGPALSRCVAEGAVAIVEIEAVRVVGFRMDVGTTRVENPTWFRKSSLSPSRSKSRVRIPYSGTVVAGPAA
jgi:hypothetical protein